MDPRCARCGRALPPEAGDADLCAACRSRTIRGATARAWLAGLVVVALYAWLLGWSRLYESPAFVFFAAVGVVLGWAAYKVARRVAFDVLRGRATGDEER
jgi:uncharacterized membrane protein